MPLPDSGEGEGPKIRDEVLEDAVTLGGMGFSAHFGQCNGAGFPPTDSAADFLESIPQTCPHDLFCREEARSEKAR
jgi:hypothetical protein